MRTFYIRHPDYKTAIQILTQDDVTAEDVVFDCLVILGDTPPTSLALGKPENIVWPAALAQTVDL